MNKNINESIIKKLKSNINGLKGLQYTSGASRGYYVSLDKRFKTTIYAKDEVNQKRLLVLLFSSINEKFDPNLLSTTTITQKRPSLLKINASLGNRSLNTTNYNENVELRLRKATLLVNGLEKPLELFLDFTF